MRTPLKVLIVEDSEADAILILRELQHNQFDITHARVETAESLIAALDREQWDIIICDYSLPKFSGEDAFEIALKKSPGTPFILVSGVIKEEEAIGLLRSGVKDIITKGHYARLLPAVEREIKAAEKRKKNESV